MAFPQCMETYLFSPRVSAFISRLYHLKRFPEFRHWKSKFTSEFYEETNRRDGKTFYVKTWDSLYFYKINIYRLHNTVSRPYNFYKVIRCSLLISLFCFFFRFSSLSDVFSWSTSSRNARCQFHRIHQSQPKLRSFECPQSRQLWKS